MDLNERVVLTLETIYRQRQEELRYELMRDPAKLLPLERRFEPELPSEHQLPRSYHGSMSHSVLDAPLTPYARKSNI